MNINLNISLNDEIRVKLTPFGLKKHKDAWKLLNIEAFHICYQAPSIDSNGYSTFQLWEFMNIFGQFLYNGAKTVIENNQIEITGE